MDASTGGAVPSGASDEPAKRSRWFRLTHIADGRRRHEVLILRITPHLGSVALPSPAQVEAATGALSFDEILKQLEAVAKKSDAVGRTAMTAAGFGLTIASVLLTESHVSHTLLSFVGVLAFVGFLLGMAGQSFYAGRRPVCQVEEGDVVKTLQAAWHKEFYAQTALALTALALGFALIGLVRGHGL